MQVEKEKTDKINQSYYCEVLNQKFTNYSTFAARLNSKKYQKALEEYKKKHKSGVQTPSSQNILQETIIDETKPSTEPQGGDFKKKTKVNTTLDNLSVCLLTNVMSESFESNLIHMKNEFGFFILDERCCKDKEGLVKYLAKIIQKKFSCIYCTARFKDSESAQKHIIAKQHLLMNADYFGQYEKFYDFKEENRKIAQSLQEKYKNLKSADNEYVYKIKNTSEKESVEKNPAVQSAPKATEGEIAEDHSEEGWEDDESKESLAGGIKI